MTALQPCFTMLSGGSGNELGKDGLECDLARAECYPIPWDSGRQHPDNIHIPLSSVSVPKERSYDNMGLTLLENTRAIIPRGKHKRVAQMACPR